MNDHVHIYQDGAQATIQLNRPEKLNAITFEMLNTLDAALQDISADQETRLVLLTAAGKRAFSVGADIQAWARLEPLDMWRKWITHGHRVFDRLVSLRQPVIAVLDGYTFGGGLELALAADIRIASERATFSAPEVKLGTIPGWAGTQRLPQMIGLARARQMIFSGERIDAQQAYEWGLVNEVTPVDQLGSRVQALAAQICANAPLAVQMAKQLINASAGYAPGVVLESLAGALTVTTADCREGLAAFQEKRGAHFEGK